MDENFESKREPDPDSTADSESDPVSASDIGEFMFELRNIARGLLSGEKNGISLSTDALVNSAFLKSTVKDNQWVDITWANRRIFFADMIRAMRRVLIERIRRQNARKRPDLLFLDPSDFPVNFQTDIDQKPEIVRRLDDALELLAQSKPDIAEIVHFHYYIGLSSREVADLLAVSKKKIDRSLSQARILLFEIMSKQS